MCQHIYKINVSVEFIITLDKHLVLYFQMVHMGAEDFKINIIEKRGRGGKIFYELSPSLRNRIENIDLLLKSVFSCFSAYLNEHEQKEFLFIFKILMNTLRNYCIYH